MFLINMQAESQSDNSQFSWEKKKAITIQEVHYSSFKFSVCLKLKHPFTKL